MQFYVGRHQALAIELHELLPFFHDIRIQQVQWECLITILYLHETHPELESVRTQILSSDLIPSPVNVYSHLLHASTGINHPNAALSSNHSTLSTRSLKSLVFRNGQGGRRCRGVEVVVKAVVVEVVVVVVILSAPTTIVMGISGIPMTLFMDFHSGLHDVQTRSAEDNSIVSAPASDSVMISGEVYTWFLRFQVSH